MRVWNEMVQLNISSDNMKATLQLLNEEEKEQITTSAIQQFLKDQGIVYGIKETVLENIQELITKQREIVIAEGKAAENGTDGKFILRQTMNQTLSNDEKKNFRDVSRIPTVQKDDLLAELTLPTTGEQGINVQGLIVKQKPGKKVRMKAGNSVRFDQDTLSFYAMEAGQLSIGEDRVQVFPVYDIKGDLSLETGNLEFVGSINIYGDVPTGYSVKAGGDINVFGLVEGAFLDAEQNIVIKEGISGLKKAVLNAGVDIQASYINQASVHAGRDILVRNSIIHSYCVAQENVRCGNGNIIGGVTTAGKTIEARDVGNVASSKTELTFGVNKKKREHEQYLLAKQKELKENSIKLHTIAKQISLKKDSNGNLPSKERIILLKQRNMVKQINDQLDEIEKDLSELQVEIGNLDGMNLIVNGLLHQNVEITFGKYKRLIQQEFKRVSSYLEDNEIVVKYIGKS
ncbi:DUF342 domain-containing protein [Saliterribacillus persicus]|uniref:Flagellar Assembly Protein A N-terminal region domain-containing protein n=1 Tax=Saliterribacillus persicus TaxID=930114 RepID=A0A368XRU3_9BACI|nr:FapA family protein [Saliterribacillus persicus]RCW70691.1 hypothetical protein DFR57_10688 [Saliterribacillus persicus]